MSAVSGRRISSPAPKVGAKKEAARGTVDAARTATIDAKEWRPEDPVAYAPLFQPTQWFPTKLVKFFFSWPGYLWPWNCIYLAVCVLSYVYTNPNMKGCYNMPWSCTLALFLRNNVLLWIFAGGWHLLLYQRKVNGLKGKYDPKWPSTDNSKFLFGDQVYDNVFWSCVSGVAVWSAYEVLFFRLWWLKLTPVYYDWWSKPYYSAAWLLAIPIWREFHFYFIHRMIHWKPLYRWVHYLHHTNTNPGPWSGLAMHPVEHLFYFSVVLIHFFVPSHPVHFLFNAQHTALTPAGGHHGFHGPVWNENVPTGSFFHYLHHRYFECNYGESTIPLDRLFGTFRDGKAVGTGIADTGGCSKESKFTTGLTMLVGIAVSLVPLCYVVSHLDF